MAEQIGLIVILNAQRAEVFEKDGVRLGSFSEAVAEFKQRRTQTLICFISAKAGFISHLAVGQRGISAGTGQRRLNLSDIRALTDPVPISRIEEDIRKTFTGSARSARLAKYILEPLAIGGLLPTRMFGHFTTALAKHAPEIHHFMLEHVSTAGESVERLTPKARFSLAAQREAISGALYIADIDREPLADWAPRQAAAPRSFIDGLPHARVLEDLVIFNDFVEPLPGFVQVKRWITGAARFEGNGVVLDVIIANKTSLETQTGADLIYFNATFGSFVLVQYKMMEPVGSRNKPSFRLPDEQLSKQIARMDEISGSIGSVSEPANRNAYRLDVSPFFLKLCYRMISDLDSVKLAPGMYLPLNYWRFLEKDADLVSERGGRTVTPDNVGRHLTNEAFGLLVRSAWVGTSPSQSKRLAPLIEALLEDGRAAVIAVKADKTN